jgi:hypothetical protein
MITINDGLTQLNGLTSDQQCMYQAAERISAVELLNLFPWEDMGSHADPTRLPHDVIYVFVAATLSCANVCLDCKNMFAHEAPAKPCVRFHFYASEFIHILEAIFFSGYYVPGSKT